MTASMTWPAGWGRCEGSATLELAILTPVLLVVVALAIISGRITVAGGAVQHAATVAARQASLARTPMAARTEATALARDSLANQGITCTQLAVLVDVSAFAVTVGNPAQVTASVDCTLTFGSLAIPLLPGTRDLSARASSALDTWRAR